MLSNGKRVAIASQFISVFGNNTIMYDRYVQRHRDTRAINWELSSFSVLRC